jgi:uncharacterized membrane protein YadS
MTLAIVLGMALGHTGYRHLAPRCGPGIDLARSRLLRLGIVLYGARLTFQDVAEVGLVGVLIAVLVIQLL